jgi:hypothetical protein
MNKTKQFEESFNAFSGLHEGLVLSKDLSKPPTPNRTYMSENHLKRGFNAFSGLHEGLVLLKDLSKPPIPNRTYMMKIYLKRGFNTCHNPIFTQGIFSGIGTQNGTAQIEPA